MVQPFAMFVQKFGIDVATFQWLDKFDLQRTRFDKGQPHFERPWLTAIGHRFFEITPRWRPIDKTRRWKVEAFCPCAYGGFCITYNNAHLNTRSQVDARWDWGFRHAKISPWMLRFSDLIIGRLEINNL